MVVNTRCSKVAQASRAASNWYFRAWPDAQAGTAVYESGICVAAAAQKNESRPSCHLCAAVG